MTKLMDPILFINSKSEARNFVCKLLSCLKIEESTIYSQVTSRKNQNTIWASFPHSNPVSFQVESGVPSKEQTPGNAQKSPVTGKDEPETETQPENLTEIEKCLYLKNRFF